MAEPERPTAPGNEGAYPGYPAGGMPPAPTTPSTPSRARIRVLSEETLEDDQRDFILLPLYPNSPVKVQMPADVLESIVRQSFEAAPPGQPRETHRETGGVLAGEARRTRSYEGSLWEVTVKEYYSMEGDATLVHFRVERETWASALSKVRERQAVRPDLKIVGVFHSHPGHGVFHSGFDNEALGRDGGLLPEEYQFSLVVDHIKGEAGVFVDNVEVGRFRLADVLPSTAGGTMPGDTRPIPAPPLDSRGSTQMFGTGAPYSPPYGGEDTRRDSGMYRNVGGGIGGIAPPAEMRPRPFSRLAIFGGIAALICMLIAGFLLFRPKPAGQPGTNTGTTASNAVALGKPEVDTASAPVVRLKVDLSQVPKDKLPQEKESGNWKVEGSFLGTDGKPAKPFDPVQVHFEAPEQGTGNVWTFDTDSLPAGKLRLVLRGKTGGGDVVAETEPVDVPIYLVKRPMIHKMEYGNPEVGGQQTIYSRSVAFDPPDGAEIKAIRVYEDLFVPDGSIPYGTWSAQSFAAARTRLTKRGVQPVALTSPFVFRKTYTILRGQGTRHLRLWATAVAENGQEGETALPVLLPNMYFRDPTPPKPVQTPVRREVRPVATPKAHKSAPDRSTVVKKPEVSKKPKPGFEPDTSSKKPSAKKPNFEPDTSSNKHKASFEPDTSNHKPR